MRQLLTSTLIFVLLSLAVYTLATTKSILIPIVLAVVIWYLIISIASGFQKLKIAGRRLPYPIAMLAGISFGAALVWMVLNIIARNIATLVATAPDYQERLRVLIDHMSVILGADRSQKVWEMLPTIDAPLVIGLLTRALTEIVSYGGVIAVYVLFLLMEHRTFDRKLAALIPDDEKLDSARKLIRKIASQTQSYLMIKTGLSLLTASCSYLVLIAVGVDFPDFWAFLIFVLNYIPTIGSIVATLFPCVLALIQFDGFSTAIVVTITLIAIQFGIGNIFEPRLMGRSFNLSGLVIVLSLTFWGQVWGLVGMFLCVPILVILNIILANFPQTRSVAIMLSQDGRIN